MSVQSTSRSVVVNAGMVMVEGERRVYWMYAIAIGITVMSLVNVDAHRSMLASCPNKVASCPNRVAAQPGVSLNSERPTRQT